MMVLKVILKLVAVAGVNALNSHHAPPRGSSGRPLPRGPRPPPRPMNSSAFRGSHSAGPPPPRGVGATAAPKPSNVGGWRNLKSKSTNAKIDINNQKWKPNSSKSSFKTSKIVFELN